MSGKNIRLALVIEDKNSYDSDGNVQIVDIKRLEPVPRGETSTLFIVETEPFFTTPLKNGAGPTFSREETDMIIKYLREQPHNYK
jgi:hypothetical protein